MDLLIKQTRVKFSAAGQEKTGEPSSDTGKRIPPQNTQSFKGEKKRSPSWLRQQFSQHMSHDYDSRDDVEHAAAVAAAAYAINSQEESIISDQKKTGEGPEPPFTKTKTISIQTPGGVSKRFSGETSSRGSKISDSGVLLIADADKKTREKAISHVPSIKKAPTSADKLLDRVGSIKPKIAAAKPDKPAIEPVLPKVKPPNAKIAAASLPTETKRQSSKRLGTDETEADKWEKAKLEKIKKRYEKLINRILSWEEKKKNEATNKQHRTESELEKRRKKSLEKFREDMEYINQIAGGARAQAEERRRNEELKAKDKANKIRKTGEVPMTCFGY
ncbi:uncharacterized protein At3g61260 isoform X2 [Carica papaya]|uniref:uncharacterized protein At3g61260 isoform X2 n=1 Tax=Carica papaya TaxID=3649 RepID=UPI000B8C8844|nr:uncharacterized protein At3g61260 isoform X2 [Carica papaya]